MTKSPRSAVTCARRCPLCACGGRHAHEWQSDNFGMGGAGGVLGWRLPGRLRGRRRMSTACPSRPKATAAWMRRWRVSTPPRAPRRPTWPRPRPVDPLVTAMAESLAAGRQSFRSDTFGSEAFWGDTLKLHTTIAGAANGGVGPGLSPKAALAIGLKVDAEALPAALVAPDQGGPGEPGRSRHHAGAAAAERGGGRDRVLQPRQDHQVHRHPVRALPFHGG